LAVVTPVEVHGVILKKCYKAFIFLYLTLLPGSPSPDQHPECLVQKSCWNSFH